MQVSENVVIQYSAVSMSRIEIIISGELGRDEHITAYHSSRVILTAGRWLPGGDMHLTKADGCLKDMARSATGAVVLEIVCPTVMSQVNSRNTHPCRGVRTVLM